MRQKEIIAALKKISDGCNELVSAFSSEESMSAPKTTKTAKAAEEEPMNPPESVAGDGYSREELMSMGYNDLKKYGASIGVKCVGNREDIVNKVLAKQGTVQEEKPEPDSGEASKESSDKIVPIKKGGLKKKSEPVKNEVEQEWLDMATEIANEAETKDIVEALEDGGVSVPKGTKKSDLITMLAIAIRDGKVVLDDEDVEEPTVTSEPDGEDDEEGEEAIDENTHFEEYDENHVNDLEAEHMTEARATAIRKFQSSVVNADELDEEGMKSFVESFCIEDELAQLGDEYEVEELLGLYLETKKRMIDDEGVTHEGGDPYEIAEEAFCCGHQLKYDKKGKKYICEVCGNEYEDGED